MPLPLVTLKMVSESHVTWVTSVPILVFLGLSVLDLGLMYATDRQHHRLMPPPSGGGGDKNTDPAILGSSTVGPEYAWGPNLNWSG